MATSTQHDLARPGCLIFVVVGLAIFQLFGLIYLLQTPDSLLSNLIPAYPIKLISGVVWFVMLLALTVALAIKKRIALRYGVWVVITFIGYRLGWITLFAQADYNQQREPFLWLTLGSLIIGFTVMRVRRHPQDDNY